MFWGVVIKLFSKVMYVNVSRGGVFLKLCWINWVIWINLLLV